MSGAPPGPRRGLLVFNPAAGSRDRRAEMEALAARWAARGLALSPVPTTGPGAATALVAGRLFEHPDLVVVCGGDGTVGEAALALVGSEVPLAILPAGTANVVAREVGVGKTLEEAERHLGSTRTTPVTVWPAAGRACLLAAGIGYEARVMARARPALKRLFGRAGIGVTAVSEWLRYEFPRLSVEGVDASGVAFEREGTLVVAANTRRYGGDFVLAPQADPADDLLDLVVYSGRSTAGLLRYFFRLARGGGRHLSLPGVERMPARSVTIRSLAGYEVEAQVDGDAAGTTPLTVGPATGTVRVVVPG